MRIMFWNTHNNADINDLLCELIIENDINIVVLAEYKADMTELLSIIGFEGRIMTEYPTAGCKRIKILGDVKPKNVNPCNHSDYYSMQLINNDCILCCIHFSSQIYSANNNMRSVEAFSLVSDINSLEKRNNTKNTIIVGDFNVDPFDDLMINHLFFHGQPIYDIAQKESRVISGKAFEMFYNPMWNMLGDFEKPYGTYYTNSNQSVGIYWHLFDQVIIRPNLRDRFIDKSLKILTRSASLSLIDNKGRPDSKISDHLPIVFEIKE